MKIFATIGFLLLVICAVVMYVFFMRTSELSIKKTRTEILEVALECKSSQKEEMERWGKLGWARYCTVGGVKDGLWMAWEEGRPIVEGQFARGERIGTWKWFDKGGLVVRSVKYTEP